MLILGRLASGMLRHVVWKKLTDVSGVLSAFISTSQVIEAAGTSETSVDFCQSTQRNIRDSHLHIRCRENLTSYQLFHIDRV